MNDAFMSLTPAAAAAYLVGNKTAELRRRPIKLAPGTRVWFYVKRPVGRVSLLGRVDEIVEASHRQLWSAYRHELAVERVDFEAYLFGTIYGSVIRLRGLRPISDGATLDDLRIVEPGFQPPQIVRSLAPDSRLLQRLQSTL